MKRNVLDSPRLHELKKHQQKVFINKILLSFLGLVVIFLSLGYISRINKLRILKINVSGNSVVDAQFIQDLVKEELTGDYGWLFPKNNILYYSKSNLETVLKNKFKRLKDITFSINGNNLEINVVERIPKYTWCGDKPLENKDDEKCYFMDDSGFVFDEAPYFSGEVYFKIYAKLWPDFSVLVKEKETLESIGLKLMALYLTDAGDQEFYLPKGNPSSTEPKIMINGDANFTNTIENLQAALTTEPLQTEFKNKYSSLLYIDLRFGNKVYYKFK